jgi:hypothetical protein
MFLTTGEKLLDFLNSNVKKIYYAPAIKDTIAVPSGGDVVLKFRTNKPGKL